MLEAEHYPDLFSDFAMPKHELLEIYRSKISVHHAKAGYSYPTIRLPYKFSKLAGLRTRIYQTVHDGALAFLVVISPAGAATKRSAEQSGIHALCLVTYDLTPELIDDLRQPSIYYSYDPDLVG
jgi:hypothetical protein